MDTSLEWKIVVGQRRFTSGHRTVVGEEEDRKKQGRLCVYVYNSPEIIRVIKSRRFRWADHEARME